MFTAKEFRQKALESLKGRWFKAIIAGFLATMLGATSAFNFDFNFGSNTTTVNTTAVNAPVRPNLLAQLPPQFWLFFGMVVLLVIIMIVIGWIVVPGYARFNLDVADGAEEVRVKTLFRYFRDWPRMALAGFLRGLYIGLWSLLLIIPGIIAYYRYSMTGFILSEHPELTANEAIALSKGMMRGNCWRLFCLEFSFIGWIFLAALTLGIGSLWLVPYMQTAFAHFYREVSTAYFKNLNA